MSHGVFDEFPDYEGSSWILLSHGTHLTNILSTLSLVHPEKSISTSRLFSGYHQLPFPERVREHFAKPGVPFREEIAPDIFRFSLWADGKIRKEDIQELEGHDLPIINIVAIWMSFRYWPLAEEESLKWQNILLALVEITGDLHTFRQCESQCETAPGLEYWYLRYQATPLLTFILGTVLFRGGSCNCMKELQNALEGWLSLLTECGVDLMKYGRRERKALRKNRAFTEITLHQLIIKGVDLSQTGLNDLKLKDIKYGRIPKDWSLVWELDAEEFAREFWDMAEEPRFPMPGEWVYD